jgi:ankyrin repeat protein
VLLRTDTRVSSRCCIANVIAEDHYSRTLLLWTSKNGHTYVVWLLLEAEGDVEAEDEYKRTALHWAAKNGYESIVKLLLEAKADVESKDERDWTALR